ncbi:MAG: DUF5067 domain-containing protein [Oscillospiraceae bacterium]|nr:DUF5067 domain-containing protein [Oscillospiraceae bacterium]
MKKKIFIIALALSLTMMSAAGCGSKKVTTVTNEGAQTTIAQKVLPPGVEYTADIGKEFIYENENISITFEEIDQTSKPAQDGRTCMALIFSAVNNSDKAITITMLDDFKVFLDGTEITFDKLFSAVSAATATQLLEGMTRYDATIEKGESIKGFVPFQVYGQDWTTMVVQYKPDAENSNDYIKYEVKKSDIKEIFPN